MPNPREQSKTKNLATTLKDFSFRYVNVVFVVAVVAVISEVI